MTQILRSCVRTIIVVDLLQKGGVIMFTHPGEMEEFERHGARKMGIIIPPATYSGRQIGLMLFVFAIFASVMLYFFH